MLSQDEESATPRADEPVLAGAVDRPCLRVEPRLDAVGRDPRSEYVETVWLLLLGQPSPQRPGFSASRCTQRSRQMSLAYEACKPWDGVRESTNPGTTGTSKRYPVLVCATRPLSLVRAGE